VSEVKVPPRLFDDDLLSELTKISLVGDCPLVDEKGNLFVEEPRSFEQMEREDAELDDRGKAAAISS
jgi:hypothetical protein